MSKGLPEATSSSSGAGEPEGSSWWMSVLAFLALLNLCHCCILEKRLQTRMWGSGIENKVSKLSGGSSGVTGRIWP